MPVWFTKPKPRPGVPVDIGDVPEETRKHIDLDARIFGSTVPRGTVTMVSGQPGCGKTTALFDVCGSVQKAGGRALYVTSEESLSALATKARAWNVDRRIKVAEAKTLTDALAAIRRSKPDFFVIDSINDLINDANVNRELVETTEGLINTVRKRGNVGVLIAHINKDGDVSGPQAIEHAVDSVVFIEVEEDTKAEKKKKLAGSFNKAINAKARRIVRVSKCRYGPDGLAGYYMLERTGITWLETRLDRVPDEAD